MDVTHSCGVQTKFDIVNNFPRYCHYLCDKFRENRFTNLNDIVTQRKKPHLYTRLFPVCFATLILNLV